MMVDLSATVELFIPAQWFWSRIICLVLVKVDPPVHSFKSDYRFRSLYCMQVVNLANKLVDYNQPT